MGNTNHNTNYINAEIYIKKDDINKDIRIINSFENAKTENKWKDKENDYMNKNEEEIKKCKIEINDKKIPFNYFIKFKETGTFKIKYIFTDYITKTTCMFYGCNSLTNINISNLNTQNVTNISEMFSGLVL